MRAQPGWPTPMMLERMGFARCTQDGCSTWINPRELTQGVCVAHLREHARQRRQARIAQQHAPMSAGRAG